MVVYTIIYVYLQNKNRFPICIFGERRFHEQRIENIKIVTYKHKHHTHLSTGNVSLMRLHSENETVYEYVRQAVKSICRKLFVRNGFLSHSTHIVEREY